MNPLCPYCHVELPKVPKGKSACPFCKKPIFVRRTPDSEPGFVLLTEADARIRTYRQKLNVTPEEIAEAEKSLPRGSQGGCSSDVMWSVLSRRVQALMRDVSSSKNADESLGQLKSLHFQMARFAFEEGKDPTPSQREAARMDLLIWKRAEKRGLLGPKTRLCIIAAGSTSCDACQRAAEKEFTLDEALKQNPLPVKGCTGWCRCCYGIAKA